MSGNSAALVAGVALAVAGFAADPSQALATVTGFARDVAQRSLAAAVPVAEPVVPHFAGQGLLKAFDNALVSGAPYEFKPGITGMLQEQGREHAHLVSEVAEQQMDKAERRQGQRDRSLEEATNSNPGATRGDRPGQTNKRDTLGTGLTLV